MDKIFLNESQKIVVDSPLEGSIYISGPAQTGKTTAALYRLEKLREIVSAHKILVITPQQSLAKPYKQFLSVFSPYHGSTPMVTTISGLCRDLTKKFWPLISSTAGYKSPNKPPTFLSLETAQYCMAKIVDPLLEKGYFQSVTIERNRLFSQILDNLNKTAMYGLPIKDISPRLKSTKFDTSELDVAFDQVQECALKFRNFCIENYFIDYSLLLTIFNNYLWPLDICQNYFFNQYKALIVDNIEEDTLFSHELLTDWIGSMQSTLVIHDENGGFRSFLGANPKSAARLKKCCQRNLVFHQMIKDNDEMRNFQQGLKACIDKVKDNSIKYEFPNESELLIHQFYPEMIQETCLKVKSLIDQGKKPGDIVILSPYLSDTLRFSLTEKLQSLEIPYRTSRPSRMYIALPEIRAMLILAKIAHPQWNVKISDFDFRHMIMEFLPRIDIIRAELITKTLFSHSAEKCQIRSFDEIENIDLQERITFNFGEKMIALRNWILKYLDSPPISLDIFLQSAFGELVSSDGFNYHHNYESASNISKLIQSIRSFRLFSADSFSFGNLELGKEYILNAEKGLIPGSFFSHGEEQEAVLIAPAFTFLMENRSVEWQFWLDIGSLGWWERLYQPLTNPYIFDKEWKKESAWTEQLDFETNQKVMSRLINGLLTRCNKGVIAASVKVNEFGSENNGPLLQAFQKYKKGILQSQQGQ